ncbi:glycosyltransferase family 4 protein [Mucilaginibacter sp. PAMB04168]|uniref:glycosyltransferase family 4 protein n=1 Tax=Mucilaginibacter sp. PAMB04168 TaxID=3138567 RepID=UPI0031F64564
MPLKILFITHKFYPDIGGIEVNSEILALQFHAAGHEVEMLTWTAASGDKEFPFRVIRQPNRAMLFKAHRWADVVFENNPSLRLSWPALFFRKPIVVALRTWINRMDGSIAWQDKLKVQWLKRASGVIAVSDAIRKRCWPAAIVIGNPYRNTLFKVIAGTERSKDFVFMGRLVSDKGADIAINAINILADKGIRKSLTIIGNGPEQTKLEQMVTALSLTEQVTFTGALSGEKLVQHLNQHQYLLVPSIWEEPFGNVALEGMACGCLPIVSDGGGLPDAVGKAGLVVKRGSVNALADSLAHLLGSSSLELELRNAAPEHLKSHEPQKVAEEYLKVIEKAVTTLK